MTFRKALILLVTFFFIATGCKTNLTNQTDAGWSSPPSGFTWYGSINGVGEFLKPDGWFAIEESNDKSNSVFISKEGIKAHRQFLTGMSVQKFYRWSKSNNSIPSNYAEEFAAKISTTGKVLLRTVVKNTQGDMQVVRVLGDNKGTPTIAHHLAIGMDSKDHVYIITYESPESEWEDNYKFGREMLNFFYLGN